ncbi:MAG: TonB-dependent receptor plug domain-containing protein, partial [Pseudomonadota bacterium]
MKHNLTSQTKNILGLCVFLVVCSPSILLAQEVSEPVQEEIVVVGIFEESDRVTGSAHRIGQDLLEEFRHDDINRVLNFVPGVYLREEDGFGLRPNIGLRGGSSDRSQKVTLMEDGVLFSPAAYSAPAAYFFPLTQRMIAVEVFKGPSSIEFGPQTIGGAINLVSAPIPQTTEFELGIAAGSDAYRSAQLRTGGKLGEFGVLAEFVHIGSDGFKDLDGGGDTGFEKNELSLKIDRELGPGVLELRLGYADEVSDETYLGLTEDDFRADSVRRYGASALDRMDWEWYGGR